MDTKKWYLSKTLQGQIVSALALIISVAKLPVGNDEITASVSAVFILIGIGYSIYGRVVTKGEKLN